MRFALAYSPGNRRFLDLLGLGPGSSGVTVEEERVAVRMGWAFRTAFARSAVREVSREAHMPFPGWGVHGWKGRWLVNGTSRNLVRIGLDPPGGAQVTGWPVSLRELWVSAEDPDGLVEALSPPGRRSAEG